MTILKSNIMTPATEWQVEREKLKIKLAQMPKIAKAGQIQREQPKSKKRGK